MHIECLNKGSACSTLVIGSFDEEYSFNSFCNDLYYCMTKSSIESYTGNHMPSSYSFVLASTNTDSGSVKDHLSELGFYTTEESKNKKNNSTVQLHVISVHTLFDKFKELGLKKESI